MITRVVPRCPGSGAVNEVAPGNNQARGRTSAEILRQSQAASIAGVLGQIAAVSEHALELLKELQSESLALDRRLDGVRTRIDAIAGRLGSDCAPGTDTAQEDEQPVKTSEGNGEESHASATRARAAMPPAVQAAYDTCEPVPPLHTLDRFCSASSPALQSSPTQSVIPSITTKYSDPEFVVTEWKKRERQRKEEAKQQKVERRRQQRALLSAQQQDEQQRHGAAPTGSATPSSSEVVAEQKLRFLNIRSWKEVYGTGEGKELARQQQQQQPTRERGSSLLELRKRSRKSFSSVTNEALGDDVQVSSSSPVASSPLSKSKKRESFGEQIKAPVATSASIAQAPGTPRGAFMQEMDDDELATEIDEFDLNRLGASDAGALPGNEDDNPDGFADHGLSYYHDPQNYAVISPPPPPPPPPLPLEETTSLEQEGTGRASIDDYDEHFMDCVDIDLSDPDAMIPPPPPPPLSLLTEAEQENSGDYDEDESPDMAQEPQTPNLLVNKQPEASSGDMMKDIRLGVALRHVKAERCETPRRQAAVSTSSLLQQILEKQRNLRSVETRPSPRRHHDGPKGFTSASPGGVFADSIARILERGTLMAYESDSAESSAEEEW